MVAKTKTGSRPPANAYGRNATPATLSTGRSVKPSQTSSMKTPKK